MSRLHSLSILNMLFNWSFANAFVGYMYSAVSSLLLVRSSITGSVNDNVFPLAVGVVITTFSPFLTCFSASYW